MKRYVLWISFLLIFLLLAACGAEQKVNETTEFRVACFACEERFVAEQLNTDFGLCPNCMMKVGAAYCQNCEKPCYTRDMIRGLCQTCSAASQETTAEAEADTIPCNLCGVPVLKDEVQSGYCPSCYAQAKYHEDERNFATCGYCGITYGYSDPLVGGICESCWSGFAGLCDTCGMPYRDGDGFEGLCFSCQDKYGPKCSVCGTDLTYRGGIDGMCDDCYDAVNSCKKCGSATYKDGYCYYCHPDFTWYCAECGRQNPDYGPADKICDGCRAGTTPKCSVCGKSAWYIQDENGICDDCYVAPKTCPSCNVYTVYRDGLCYWCQPDIEFICSICGESKLCPVPNSNVCYDCDRQG